MVHTNSNLEQDACYLALKARDARFDGRFFTGVTSTGIYCRPVCGVRTPRRENCRFFNHAAKAESAGFRPCLRCRPELAPQSVVWSIQDASSIQRLQQPAPLQRRLRGALQAQPDPVAPRRLGVVGARHPRQAGLPAAVRRTGHGRDYLATDGHAIHWDLIRAACASLADTAIHPLQDVLGLGAEHRMNLPGKGEGSSASVEPVKSSP